MQSSLTKGKAMNEYDSLVIEELLGKWGFPREVVAGMLKLEWEKPGHNPKLSFCTTYGAEYELTREEMYRAK